MPLRPEQLEVFGNEIASKRMQLVFNDAIVAFLGLKAGEKISDEHVKSLANVGEKYEALMAALLGNEDTSPVEQAEKLIHLHLLKDEIVNAVMNHAQIIPVLGSNFYVDIIAISVEIMYLEADATKRGNIVLALVLSSVAYNKAARAQ